MGAGEEQNAVPLVWSRARPAPRRQAMSADRIVVRALHIADTEGLEALSMRRVAADLGSGTTSLYRHVANRDELLDLMMDAIQGAEPPAVPTGDWRADLARVAHRLRRVLLRHPWAGTLMTTRPSLGPHHLRQMDNALAAAAQLTPDATLAANVIALLTRYVFGAVAAEVAEREVSRRTGLTEEQWRASVAPYIRDVVASGRYPQFARRVVEADELTPDDQFEFGLSCVLDGIAARLAP